ncbi:hypothetical protein G7Z17_g11320 [Cylindrodendrum hubeiense]|uniref:Uncharacterized protein n=1 Tax=Cylindrodendrum hubeiense TaxID=595255 RepID=A0A9P5H468_9HYPO|nr:hypothetical protein G7Z17_g11320 [Cylindrodendrum hubeiense]
MAPLGRIPKCGMKLKFAEVEKGGRIPPTAPRTEAAEDKAAEDKAAEGEAAEPFFAVLPLVPPISQDLTLQAGGHPPAPAQPNLSASRVLASPSAVSVLLRCCVLPGPGLALQMGRARVS